MTESNESLNQTPDSELKKFGYAPGNYLSECRTCGARPMDMDKLAWCCKPCALKKHAAMEDASARKDEGFTRPDVTPASVPLTSSTNQTLIQTLKAMVEEKEIGHRIEDDGGVYLDCQDVYAAIRAHASKEIPDSSSEIPVIEAGDNLPGMVQISKLIADLQRIKADFGDTCVYIKPGVSWGAVALNRQNDDEKAVAQTAASFADKFKPEYKELALQIMSHAISEGWVHAFKREIVRHDAPIEEMAKGNPIMEVAVKAHLEFFREERPAYGGCLCPCHSNENFQHIAPCCYPEQEK